MKDIRVVKISTTISFIFITLVLYIILKTPPATSYEISIYAPYPWYFWILLLFNIVVGFYIMVYYAFKENLKDRGWIFGLSLIIFSNLIILLLPFFRGYSFYCRNDALSHLGIVKDTISLEALGDNNIYPISHILAVNISYVLDIDPLIVVMIMPSLFYLFYIMFLFIFARVLTKEPGEALLIIAFGSVLYFTYFSTWFLTSQFCFYIFPLILFLNHKKNLSNQSSFGYRILFILVLFTIPFFHPFGVLFLILSFIILAISSKLYNSTKRQEVLIKTQKKHKSFQMKGLFTSSLMLLYIFFMWISTFIVFPHSILRLYNWFVYEIGRPPTEMYQQQLTASNFTIYDFIELFIMNYGHALIFILISLFSLIIVFRKIFFSQKGCRIEEFFISLLFVSFVMMFILFLFIDFYTSSNPYRMLIWALFLSCVLNGIVIHDWITKKLNSNKAKNRKILKKNSIICLLTILLVVSATIGIFNTHTSPVILRANQQVTQKDFTGAEWFSIHKNPETSVACIDQMIYRAPAAIWGAESPEKANIGNFFYPPSHFGYDTYNSTAYTFEFDTYLVIDGYNKKMYKELYTDVGSFSPDDFEQLNSDQAINKLYFNGEVEIYKISVAKNE